MSLYIRDNHVDELATALMQRLGTRTKTEAVRRALENELERTPEPVPLKELIKTYQSEVAEMGQSAPSYDHKAHMDEGWDM